MKTFIIKIILLFVIHLCSFLSLLAVMYLQEPEFLIVWTSKTRSLICAVLNILFCQVYVLILYKIKGFEKEEYRIIFRLLNFFCFAFMVAQGVILQILS